jgi:hypothetical protein
MISEHTAVCDPKGVVFICTVGLPMSLRGGAVGIK